MTRKEMLSIMKTRRGEQTIILFRNANLYEAYYSDAERLANLLGENISMTEGIPALFVDIKNISEVLDKLSKADTAVCISEMQDSDGNFVPMINYEEE